VPLDEPIALGFLEISRTISATSSEKRTWVSAELLARPARIAQQVVHFGRTEMARIDRDDAAPF